MFTGQERDGGTATLDFFHARNMSARTGSFMQLDPINAGADFTHPQSWNAYAYVLGNPLDYADPSGM
jgi:RHS repeat-associated protein